jgi:hypothetical protein
VRKALTFVAIVLLLSIPLELLITTSAEQKEAFGLLVSCLIIYTIYGSVGSVIHLKKISSAKWMGVASLTIGFILEFLLIKPSWVQDIYAMNLGNALAPTVISGVYWFLIWALPTYILRKKMRG